MQSRTPRSSAIEDLGRLNAQNALGGRNRHICAFFNGMDEHYRVLQSFIKDGLDNGDRAFHLVDPERREDHVRRLADAGIDVEEAIASGQLEVHPWEDGPLHGERFDQETWLAGFEEVLQAGRTSGYAKTRFLAQMEWALVDLPGVEDLIEFETRVNYVVPKYDDAVICAYDLSKFGASTVVYALRTHPAVIIGGLLQENPFYVDPEQLLSELRERRSSRVGAGMAH
jgi:DcmR-like sensory protein